MTTRIFVSFCSFFLISTFVYAGTFDLSVDDTKEVIQKRYYRHLYFQMPLSLVEFHWEFLDRANFLKGELVLEFTSEGKTIKQTVFAHGTLSSKWKVVSDSDKEEAENATNNVIYFAFESKQKYWLTKTDSATLTFSTPNTLQGWGPDFRAQLPAGNYVASAASFSLYEDDLYDSKQELMEANAFLELENWNKRWTLQNIIKPGWERE